MGRKRDKGNGDQLLDFKAHDQDSIVSFEGQMLTRDSHTT